MNKTLFALTKEISCITLEFNSKYLEVKMLNDGQEQSRILDKDELEIFISQLQSILLEMKS